MKWRYPLTMPTSRLDRSPGKVEGGESWLTIGADPRYVDVLRRYPGHVRYPDTDGVLDTGSPGVVLNSPEKIRPFVVAEKPGSSTLVRGFVAESENANLKVFWRYDSDAAGKLRKTLPDQTGERHQNAVTSRPVDGSAPSALQYLGYGGSLYSGTIAATADEEYPYTVDPAAVPVGAVTASCIIDGEYYIAGRIQQIGAQGSDLRLWSVWRKRKDAWERIGGTFNGDIHAIVEFNGRLVIGGGFTTVSSSTGLKAMRYIAQMPLEPVLGEINEWTELGGGITVVGGSGAAVFTFCASTISGNNALLVGGYGFTEVGGSVTCDAFAVWDDDAFAWDDYGSDGALATTTSVLSITECEDGANATYFWLGVGGAVGTAGVTHGVTAFEPGGPTWTAPGSSGGTPPPAAGTEVALTVRHGTVAAGKVFVYVYDSPGGEMWFGELSGNVATITWTSRKTATNSSGFASVSQMVSGDPEVDFIFLAFKGAGVTDWGSSYCSGYDVGGDTFTDMDPATTSYVASSVEGIGFAPLGALADSLRGLTVAVTHNGGSDGVVYLGGNYHSSAAGTGIGLSGKSWDITMRGHLLYILVSDGNHVVVTFDGPGNTVLVKPFGPGVVLPAAGMTTATGGTGSPYGIEGQYNMAFRYFDPLRLRWTAMSVAHTATIAAGPANVSISLADPSADINSYCAPDPGYKYIVGYQSLGSLDTTVPPGGTLYRAGHGSITTTPHAPVLLFMWEPAAGGATTEQWRWWPTSDAFLAVDPTRIWDPFREVVGEVTRVYATTHFEGVTFAVEERDGQLDLRWSPSWRVEPENFPYTNTFPLQVPVSDGGLCRFLAARDALILLAGSKAYRIDKRGTAIQVSTIYDGYSLLHTDAAVVVGNTVFAATQDGLVEINAQDGTVTPLPQLSRVFRRRWRGNLTPGDATASVRLGYDERMKSLYLLHVGLSELFVLSLETAAMTLLPYCGARSLFTCKDLDTGLVDRCYLLGESGWLAYPNAEEPSGQPRTMGGARMNSAQISCGFNFKPASVAESGTPVSTAKLTVPGEYPFSRTNVSGGGVADHYVQTDAFVIPLTGAHAGTAMTVNAYDEESLTVNVPSGYVAGDFTTATVFSLDPVVFGVVGSNLWQRQGIPDAFYRRRITGGGVAVASLASEAVIPAVPLLDTSYGLLEFSACLGDDAVASEPKTASTEPVVPLQSTAQILPGESLETGRSSRNWGYLLPDGIVDGNVVLPVVQSYVSDLDLWLHELMVEGFLDSQVTAGPRE